MDARRTRILLAALYLLTAALHARLLWGVRVAPYIAHDEVQYCMIGENIHAGNGFVIRGLFASTAPPLYPLFVALGDSLPGDARVNVYILSVLVICTLLFPVYAIAREFGLDAPVAAAAAFTATFLPQTFYAGMYMSETLQLPLFFLAFWLCLRWLRSGALSDGLRLGAVFGIMALNRFATFTFLACFLIAAILTLRRRAVLPLTVAAATAALFQLAWWGYKSAHGAAALGTYATTPRAWGHIDGRLFLAYLADPLLAPGLILAAPFIAGLRRLWHKQRGAALLAAVTISVLVSTTALSDGSQTGFLRERYFIYCFPLILLLALAGAREYFQAAPLWTAALMLFALPAMCLFALELYDFHIPPLVESSWAHAVAALPLSGSAGFEPARLLPHGLLLIAIAGAILTAARRRFTEALAVYLVLFHLYAFARVSRDVAATTRGIAAGTAPLIDLFPRPVKPLQKVLVAGVPPGWDAHPISRDPRFLEAAAAAGLSQDRIWYLETMERLDVRMCGAPGCIQDPAAAGAYFLTAAEFPKLEKIAARGSLNLYRIPGGAARNPAAADYTQTIPAADFLTKIGDRLPDHSLASRGRAGFLCYGPYRKLPKGRYKLVLSVRSQGEAAIHADVAAAGTPLAAADGSANHFPPLEFVSDGEAFLEFRIVTNAGREVIFEGVKLSPAAP